MPVSCGVVYLRTVQKIILELLDLSLTCSNCWYAFRIGKAFNLDYEQSLIFLCKVTERETY